MYTVQNIYTVIYVQGAAPTITGWYSTLMIQSGETARCRGYSRGWCYLT